MYVCICNAVTDRQILEAVSNGCATVKDLGKQLNVGTCCGCCVNCARKILAQATFTEAASAPQRVA